MSIKVKKTAPTFSGGDFLPPANDTYWLGRVGNVWAGIRATTIVVSGVVTGDLYFNDNDGIVLGTGNDSQITYDGTNLKIEPRLVGSGNTVITDGILFINDTANTNMDTGLTMKQAAGVNNEIFAGKSEDVAHGMTTITETDTYVLMKKASTSAGGLDLWALADSGSSALNVVGFAVTDDTTKSTAGRAYVNIFGQKKTGTTGGAAGADGNVLAVITGSNALWIVDAEGDTWQAGGITTGGEITSSQAAATSVYLQSIRTGASSDDNDLLLLQARNNSDSQNKWIKVGLNATEASEIAYINIGKTGGGTPSFQIKFDNTQKFDINSTTFMLTLAGGITATGASFLSSSTVEIHGAEGAAGQLQIWADEGDDNADKWMIQAYATGDQNFTIASYSTGSWVDLFELDSSGNLGIDGQLTTAIYYENFFFEGSALAAGDIPPDSAVVGRYNVYYFDIGDDTIINFPLPTNYVVGSDIEVHIRWMINEAYATANGEIQWRVDWSATPNDSSEAIDGPTHTGQVNSTDINIPATAKTIKETTITIPGTNIIATDEIGLDIERIAINDGTNPTADPGVICIGIKYAATTLGSSS